MDIKMHDTAEKPVKMDIAKPSNKVYRPTVYFDTKQLPELKDREIGDEFYVVQLVKIVGIRKRESEKDTRSDYDLEVQKVGLKEKSKSKELFGNYKSPNSL